MEILKNLDNIVFYFNEDNENEVVAKYIENNILEIKQQFLEQNFRFFVFPNDADIKTLKDLYLYCFPTLYLFQKELIGDNISLDNFYKQNVNSGFLIVKKEFISVIEYGNDIFFEIDDLYKNLQPTFWDIFFNRKKKTNEVAGSKDVSLNHFYKKELLPTRLNYLFGKYKPILKPNLVEQIKRFNEAIFYKYNNHASDLFYSLKDPNKEEKLAWWLKKIENKLVSIDSTEELYDTITRIEELTNIIKKQSIVLTKDFVKIADDYKIRLPLVNNVEVLMSDLTKAVYILFYNNPLGIDINELNKYKNELIKIYSNISSLLDYDKIVANVDKICNIESKEIYVHISRIKKSFENKLDPYYSDKLIVTSSNHGNPLKFIRLLKIDVNKKIV